MNILALIMAYAPSKSMKYLGQKGNIEIVLNKKKQKLLFHHIQSLKKISSKVNITPHVVLGFGADTLIEDLVNKSIDFSIIPDFDDTNHGTIIKRLLNKYDSSKYDGMLLSHDLSFCMDGTNQVSYNDMWDSDKSHIRNNIIFTTKSKKMETNISCLINEEYIQNIFYDVSDTKWTGCVLLSNTSVKLLKHINNVYNIEKLFTIEIINYMIEIGDKFINKNIKEIDFSFINNQKLKKTVTKSKSKG